MARALLTPADLPQLPRVKINSFLDRSVNTVITTPVTLDDTDLMVMVDDDTVGGAVTVNLPAVADSAGNVYYIKKLGTGGDVTVDGSGSETIDGGTTAILTEQYECITVYCDGATWWII